MTVQHPRLWRYVCKQGHTFDVAWMHAGCPKCNDDADWASVELAPGQPVRKYPSKLEAANRAD